MDLRKKRILFAAGGGVLALLVAVVLIIVLSGGGDRDYTRHYDAAQAAFLRQDYDKTVVEAQRALESKPTEEAYLLLASAYDVREERDRAMQVLYLGYSKVGGDGIAAMLDRMKEDSRLDDSPKGSEVTVAGVSYAPETTSVVLTGKDLGDGDLAELCRLTELENLSISDNDIRDIAPIAGLRRLTTLQLSDNSVSDLAPLSGLTNLKTLYLDGNPVEDVKPLYELRSLRTLSMKKVDLTAKDLAELADALPECSVFSDVTEQKVTKLSLGGKTFYSDVTELSLTGLELTDISVLRDCRALVHLDLRDNKIRDLSPLVELQNLEELNIWNNEVSDITPLVSLSKLRYLDADSNRLTDVTALEYLPELQELWLNNNELRSVKPLKGLTALTRLGLKHVGLKDGELQYLSGLTALRELNIEENPDLTAGTFETLQKALPRCAIAHSELFWTLDLGGQTWRSDCTELRAVDAGIRDLSGLERFTKLKVLELDGNEIADLAPLSGLTALEKLSLQGNPLELEAVEALRQQLPNCEILFDPPQPEEPEEPEEPEATEREPEPEAVGLGAGAALAAAGTGSGYAILWRGDEDYAADVRQGFVDRAEQLGMNLVYDSAYPTATEDFSDYLRVIRRLGGDTLFLVGDDMDLAKLYAQATKLGYAPKIIQIYQ